MLRLILHWVSSALCLLAVAHLVPGFHVRSFGTALIAALLIGFFNGTLGLILKVVTFPLTILTFGLFWFIINALMLELASAFVPGFQIIGFLPALVGSLILSILNLIVRSLML